MCLPLSDSLPREQQVFSNRGPVGDFGFVDGPLARETPVVRDGRGGPSLPSATAQLPNPQGSGREKEGPYRAVGPSPVQSIAPACRAGDVSTRYFSPFLRTGSLRVRGSRRSFAALRRRAMLARDPPQLHQFSGGVTSSCGASNCLGSMDFPPWSLTIERIKSSAEFRVDIEIPRLPHPHSKSPTMPPVEHQ